VDEEGGGLFRRDHLVVGQVCVSGKMSSKEEDGSADQREPEAWANTHWEMLRSRCGRSNLKSVAVMGRGERAKDACYGLAAALMPKSS
jgi:hypothetical protein